jgi:sugar lactone lactonase YvrE
MQGRLIAAITTIVTLGVAVTAGAAQGPDRIDLPNGWQPEGVASGPGGDLFVGSIPTGSVLRVDPRTGDSSVAVPGADGHAAIGLKADRDGRLFVAGGPTGKAFVYDAQTGAGLASFQLAPVGEPTFVNDVTLTRGTAYFTDSMRNVVYAVATDLSGFEEVTLNGIELQPGNNLNGIVATGKRKQTLLAVQTNVGRLWRIDAETGDATEVDLGGANLINGDGLLLSGRTLYAVQNRDNKIAVLRLKKGLSRAEVVRTITNPDFDVPTTIARQGGDLWAVNARFGTTPTPDTEYWLTRVGK